MIILSDVDGTLIRDGKIDSELKVKINSFRQDNMFILATGRGKESVKKASRKYGLDFFDYAICSSGACVIDKFYNIVIQEALSIDQVHFIVDFFNNDNNVFEVILTTEEGTHEMKSKDLNCHLKESIYSLTLVSSKITNGFFAYLRSSFKKHFLECIRNGIYIDITSRNIGKYKSMELLKNELLLPQETIIFSIGDNENDIEMLSEASVSFTFKDSKPCVKKHANFVLETYIEIFNYI